jgi:hypothetical protein
MLVIALPLIGCNYFSSPPANDVIVYTDIRDSLVQSVRYFYKDSIQFPCDSGAVPRDSSNYFHLDLDNDGQMDFAFISAHAATNCPFCPNVIYRENTIHALHNLASIAVERGNRLRALRFSSGDSISYYEEWSGSRIQLSIIGQCDFTDFTFKDKLFGVKLNGKVGWLHLARTGKNGLIVSEWAFNQTEFRGITAALRN